MTTKIQISSLMRRYGLTMTHGQLISWSALCEGLVMRDFINPKPGIPFLVKATADSRDQIHHHISSEVTSHGRRAIDREGGVEPNVEPTFEEVRIMEGTLTRAANLLRMVLGSSS